MPEPSSSVFDPVAALGALSEPSRRALYDYVVTAGDWVGRDEAADAVGLQRGIAAHHLDRLADDGLLEIDYQRLTGRTGPGAGRPAKLYRRAPRDLELSLPPRAYQFAGRLLADAVADSQSTGVDIGSAVDAASRDAGAQLGREMKERLGRRRSGQRAREAALEVLREHGFEPLEHDDGIVVLRNCPFHLLAQHQRALICGMNHCLIDAALGEFGAAKLQATLEPDPEVCCVRLHRG